MKIVIDIDEHIYEQIMADSEVYVLDNEVDRILIENAIYNGTPLPEHHGRLIDADRTLTIAWQNFYKHEDEWEKKDEDYLPIHRFYDQLGFECCQQTIVNAPTIIEGSESE